MNTERDGYACVRCADTGLVERDGDNKDVPCPDCTPDVAEIERFNIAPGFLGREPLQPSLHGAFITFTDHLDALGEAEARLFDEQGAHAVRNAELKAAEAKLETLRSDIATVVGHLKGLADSIEAFGVEGNGDEEKLWRALREDARRLLDVSEDTK